MDNSKNSTHTEDIPDYLQPDPHHSPSQQVSATAQPSGGGTNGASSAGMTNGTGTTGTPAGAPSIPPSIPPANVPMQWGAVEYALAAIVAYFILVTLRRQ